MLKLEVRDLDSPDLLDLDIEKPQDLLRFCILVQASIGVQGERGEDLFNFLVCTPAWLVDGLKTEGKIWGRHHLFVPEYDYDQILQAINEICGKIEASDWETAAHQLAWYTHWEFEDYRELEDYETAAVPDLAGVK